MSPELDGGRPWEERLQPIQDRITAVVRSSLDQYLFRIREVIPGPPAGEPHTWDNDPTMIALNSPVSRDGWNKMIDGAIAALEQLRTAPDVPLQERART